MVWKMFKSTPHILRRIKEEHSELDKMIDGLKLDAVISDNRFGLYTDKVPCVYMTHQVMIKAPFFETMLYRLHADYMRKFARVWVPDFEKNGLSATLEDAIVRPKATYIAADGYGKTAWEALQKVAPKKTKNVQHVVFKSEKGLDQLLASHPTLAALPSDAHARKELAKLSPKSRKYVYVMMDSGASRNVANLQKHFPWLANQLKPNNVQRRRAFAHTSNGEKLYYEGEFTVDGDCNGVPLSLNFTNMQVEVPIASVRKFVKSGNDVAFYEGGGCIVNRESKDKVKFVELGGVYFPKVRVKAEQSSTLGFARPVR